MLNELRDDGRVAVGARLEALAAALLFSTGGAVIKATTLTAWQVASLRAGIAAIALVLLLPARRRWTGRALAVGVAYGATTTLFVAANKLTTAANTIFLQSSAPLYVLLLSPWLLKERISRSDLVSMSLIAVGLGMFFVGMRPPDRLATDPLLGNVLAVCSGVTWALTLVGLRWLGKSGDSGGGLKAVVSGNVMAFLFGLALSLPYGETTATDWAAVLFLGLMQIGLAYVLLARALERVPALEASLLLLIEPVLSPVWAWLLHAEAPGVWALGGGALILGATALRTAVAFVRARTPAGSG
jgi:drug/metabolite transporter, DME family